MKQIVDLHFHSLCSDGKLKVSEVVLNLKKHGINVAALTDHDSTEGVKEFKLLASKAGIVPISGVEISTFYENIGFHILGYGMDIRHPGLVELFRRQSIERQKGFVETVKRFRRAGFYIDPRKFNQLRHLKTVAKPHIVALICDAPQNRLFLAHKFKFKVGANSMGRFIDRFMSKPGQIGYFKKGRVSSQAAIALIHRAGGIAVWAHPGVEKDIGSQRNLFRILGGLKHAGLDGLECFSNAHSVQQRKFFYNLARRYKLIATTGSDDHDGKRMGRLEIAKEIQGELVYNLARLLKA